MRRRAFLAAGAATAVSSLFSYSAFGVPDAGARIAVLAKSAQRALRAPWFAYGVVRDRRIVLRQGLGVQQAGKTAAVTPQTLFHAACVMRPLIATVIAKRVEEGRLRLDERIGDVLPQFRAADARARSITIEHVLTQSSGLPDDFSSGEGVSRVRVPSEYESRLSDLRLLFAPGEGFAASGIGLHLLGRVIEVLDGATFEAALRRAILRPLAMHRSTLSDSFGRGSALRSCVDDLLRWVQVNLDDGELDGVRIMSAKTAQDLRAPRPIEIGAQGYPAGVRPALGWFVLPRAGREIVAHGEGGGGFASVCLFCPRGRFGLVALAKGSDAPGRDSLRSFALAAIDEGLLEPAR